MDVKKTTQVKHFFNPLIFNDKTNFPLITVQNIKVYLNISKTAQVFVSNFSFDELRGVRASSHHSLYITKMR